MEKFLERHKLQKLNQKQVDLGGTEMMTQDTPELPSPVDALKYNYTWNNSY